MKKGKSIKINGFKDFKINYGTVDFKSMKSIYLVIQAWVEPITDLESWSSVVNTLRRDIKHKLLDSIDLNIFNGRTIVDLDLRTSGIQEGKRSFMNLEITLFLDEYIDFKSEQLKKSLTTICKYITKNSFKSNRYFSFHLSKMGSPVKMLV
jgi:hypothetical protein